MNLVDDPWIPVTTKVGASRTVGLADLFEDSETLADLAVEPAHRIALMRMLIAIVQAALDGPADERDWQTCRDNIQTAARTYLDKRRNLFELYGDRPFMQVADMRLPLKTNGQPDESKLKPHSFIDCRRASGNNSTMFDHEAASAEAAFTDAELTVNLISFHCFSLGGKVGTTNWKSLVNGESTFAAPCVGHAYCFIVGESLTSTIHANLLTKQDANNLPGSRWGMPTWDHFPDSPDNREAFENMTLSYLGSLLPMTRALRLRWDEYPGYCSAGPTHDGSSKQTDKWKIPPYLPEFRDPFCTVIPGKDDTVRYLGVQLNRHMWRDLASVLQFKVSERHGSGPIPLKRLERITDTKATIWVGGVSNNQASYEDILEWHFTFPITLLNNSSLNKYKLGVDLAVTAEYALRESIKRYFHNLKQDPKIIAKRTDAESTAASFFWDSLNARFVELIDTANAPERTLNDRWYSIVRDAMEHAFNFVCPHDSPRQWKAFAEGRDRLRLTKPESEIEPKAAQVL